MDVGSMYAWIYSFGPLPEPGSAAPVPKGPVCSSGPSIYGSCRLCTHLREGFDFVHGGAAQAQG